ncbi:haloacid dehalogenase [Aureimonas endophytica]|uniref:(S)-2-haloacid dehalogenase n=1 Tax=Aureimonas endophytica TaxID=2027858 RepID=A0A916ZYD1_9HYPH|nr:haloacid dehalogenase type II [Aureimonas endophytica]GGE19024.1 haloacid dehalogenase [Aureimonas endophytica]
MPTRPQAVAFDIIDTVFRLDALGPALAAHGLAVPDVETLYAALLRDAMALASAGGFAPLPEILGGALDQLRVHRGLRPSAEAREAVAGAMKELEPFADAGAAFRRLKDGGIAVHALSNGARSATEALLARAGFAELFTAVHSVEGAKTYKPHPAIYRAAIAAIGLAPQEVMLVATHAWDCHGAKRAGMTAGFVRRGQDWPKAFDRPDVTGEDLLDTAEAILRLA